MQLTQFTFENGLTVRVPFTENETSWFIASDICNILSLSDTSQSIERLDADEKRKEKIVISGQSRPVWLINEFGLYTLILSSEKEEAKQFKRWITHVILPTLRKTGKYTLEEANQRETLIQTKINEIEIIETKIKQTKDSLSLYKEELSEAQIQLKQILKTNIQQTKIDFNTEQV